MRVFGVNSKNSKPGPKPATERNLLIWEHEWYWIFNGLVRGIPATDGIEQDWEPIRPPKRSGRLELDEERLAHWNAKTRTQEGWIPRRYRRRTRGRAAEPDVWLRLIKARTPAQVRKAYRSSRFWLNPSTNMRGWVAELEKHAAEFVNAKTYRYPGSQRQSSEEKRILHFARTMAGVMTGIGSARAVDLIRTMKHGEECNCVKCHVGRWNVFERAATRALTLEAKRLHQIASANKVEK
jgi:hypothetical protein